MGQFSQLGEVNVELDPSSKPQFTLAAQTSSHLVNLSIGEASLDRPVHVEAVCAVVNLPNDRGNGGSDHAPPSSRPSPTTQAKAALYVVITKLFCKSQMGCNRTVANKINNKHTSTHRGSGTVLSRVAPQNIMFDRRVTLATLVIPINMQPDLIVMQQQQRIKENKRRRQMEMIRNQQIEE